MTASRRRVRSYGRMLRDCLGHCGGLRASQVELWTLYALQNADLLHALERNLPGKRVASTSAVSFHEINHYIADCLAGALLPYCAPSLPF